MIPENAVLLLGAGASMPYGFPSGAELTRDIIQRTSDVNLFPHESLHLDGGQVERFVVRFKGSRLNSIDAFLAQNPDLGRIGLGVVAAIMLDYERSCRRRNLDMCGRGKDWYRYLWHLVYDRSFDELDFTTWKVVTFNYDRSLQAYLFDVMLHAYPDVEPESVLEKLRTLEIVHVYGSLGNFFKGDDHQPFGPESSKPANIECGIRSMRVIPQARDTDACILRAREVLKGASRIAVLGFGFDELNLRRLAASETLTTEVIDQKGQKRHRRVVVSCYGKTVKEAQAIARACGQGVVTNDQLPRGYRAADSEDTLREELVLGEWGNPY